MSENNTVTHSKPNAVTIADTGATDHFFSHIIHSIIPNINVRPITSVFEFILSNSNTMKETRTEELDIPELPKKAIKVHIFTHLASGSLLSIGQLFDLGCREVFTATKLYILYKDKLIMQGTLSDKGFWKMDNENKEKHKETYVSNH